MQKQSGRTFSGIFRAFFLFLSVVHVQGEPEIRPVLKLPPSKGNPRNSEGDFIKLKDGRILFVYTHFTGGAADHASAFLAGRYSHDGGRTWSGDDVVVVPNEGKQNVMSVSLLRLSNGAIALFYAVKNALTDCRPYLRISKDEGKTWSEPKSCITDEVGYYVLNNDRVVQLESGRLLMPVALHNKPAWKRPDWKGTILCYFSDDNGAAWSRSGEGQKGYNKKGARVTVQEPGVVELSDGRVMMFCRTNAGCQYISFSRNKGKTWSPLAPSNIISPISPASIERVPGTEALVMAWNNHRNIEPHLKGKRTPFCLAVSHDDGRSWTHEKVLADNPHGWYCYTAVFFVEDALLLGHCAGDRRANNGLAETHVTRVPLRLLGLKAQADR